jgi:uncharacterized membrane protein YdjX (TVP38/TMEM64 family)
VLTLGGLVLLGRISGIGAHFDDLRVWIEGLGSWGPLVFSALYVFGVVAALPGSAITVVAGALFGSVVGVVVVSVGSTVGAALSFLISRYVARDAVERWMEERETFRQLDEMTRTHGAIIVALTRLVPVFPFVLLNYGFGLTRVRFRTYVFWSWLCMLPATVLYVLGGEAVVRGLADGRVPWGLVAGIGASVLVLLALGALARGKLRRSSAVVDVEH